MRVSIMADEDGIIDYNDMIYMPIVAKAEFQMYDLVLVDEAQDLDPIQHEILQASLDPDSGRLIVVGDPNQAIYGFRGADADSFQTLIQRFGCEVYPLTVSFRCPKAVVKQAQTLVPAIESAPEAPEGIVEAREIWKASEIKVGDAILCRNTAPLIPIFYRLIGAGVPAKVMGSEIGKGLITIVKNKIRGDTKLMVSTSIDEWSRYEYNKAHQKGFDHQAALAMEKGQILHMILERVADFDPKAAMIQDLKRMFSKGVAPVTLSTIHRAKGLEFPRVWFVDDHLIPSKYATQPWQIQQEHNLMYVGITRAQKELYFVPSAKLEE